MMRQLLSLVLIFSLTGLLFCLTGCSEQEDSAKLTRQSSVESSGADPVRKAGNSYRAGLTKKALRGLDYSTGRVIVNLREAVIVTRGLTDADAALRYESGKEALASGQILEAIEFITQAVILSPGQVDYYEVLGQAMMAKRKASHAEAVFRTVLDMNPNSIEANRNLAFVLAVAGRTDEAIAQYQRTIKLEPADGHTHSRLAILYYYRGNARQARQHVAKAMQSGYSAPPQFQALLDGEVKPRALNLIGGGPPIIGAQTRVDVTNTAQANETTAAASNFDPNCVVAGWNDYRDGIKSGFALSLDGGESWSDFLLRPPVANQAGTEGDPMTAADDRTGTIWAGAIAFGGNGGVYVARKNQGNATFQPAVMAEITGGADKGWMAAGPDPDDANLTRLYVGYNQGLLISTDEGDSFSGPFGFPESGLGWLPRIGPNGEIYLSYWDASDGIKLLRSFDGGNTFDPPITIATRMDVWFVEGTRFPGRFRVAPLVTMAVDPNDGTLYSVWFDTTNIVDGNSNVDIYFSKSIDHGTNWTTPVVINNDAATPGDQFFSWIEVDESGRIHLLFYDTRSIPQNDNTTDGPGQPPAIIEAYYSYSDDGGNNWTESVLTPAPFSSADDGFGDGFIGDYLGMAVTGTTVYPCYLSTQEGTANIYVHKITSDVLLGDINRDGLVNLLDVQPFIELLANGEFDKAADINGDGELDLLDVDPFVALLAGEK